MRYWINQTEFSLLIKVFVAWQNMFWPYTTKDFNHFLVGFTLLKNKLIIYILFAYEMGKKNSKMHIPLKTLQPD